MILSGKTKMLLLAAGIAFATSISAAAAAEFSDIDSNEDDVLSLEEFQEYFGAKIGRAAFNKYNTDKCESGTECVEGVTSDEISKSNEQGRTNSSAGMKRAYENQQKAAENAAAGRDRADKNRGGGDRGGQGGGEGRGDGKGKGDK